MLPMPVLRVSRAAAALVAALGLAPGAVAGPSFDFRPGHVYAPVGSRIYLRTYTRRLRSEPHSGHLRLSRLSRA